MMNGEMRGNYNPPKIEREKYSLEKKDVAFLIFSVISSIAFVILALWGSFKIGYTCSFLLFFFVTSFYLYKKENKLTFFGTLSGILAVISSFVFSYSNNFGVKFYLFVLVFFESAIWFNSLSGIFDNNDDLLIISKIFSTVFGKGVGKIGKTFATIFDNKNEKIKGMGKAIIGVLCALPVLTVVVPLLISADGAFEGFVENIGENFNTLIKQIILGICIAPFVFTYAISMKKDTFIKGENKETKGLENIFIISFLSSLAIVYIVYLFSQLAYFVDAFKGMLPEKFIPSEYARRGFFEMSIIAGINFVIIYLALIFSRKKNDKPSKVIGGVCTFIILFTLFLISTAIAKMIIYINYFGMSVLRISTSTFMIFLAIVFLALIFRCFIKKIPVIKIMLVAATMVLLTLGFGNVEKFVADYNVLAYKENKLKSIDVEMIADLELSGVPALYDIYKNVPEYSSDAAKKLCRLYNEVEEERKIGDWSVTDKIALDILKEFGNENGLNKKE